MKSTTVKCFPPLRLIFFLRLSFLSHSYHFPLPELIRMYRRRPRQRPNRAPANSPKDRIPAAILDDFRRSGFFAVFSPQEDNECAPQLRNAAENSDYRTRFSCKKPRLGVNLYYWGSARKGQKMSLGTVFEAVCGVLVVGRSM